MENIKVSRTIAHALRHKPEQYNLTLNVNGWVEIAALADALTSHFKSTVTVEQISEIVETDSKQRYTVRGSEIRAAQGHSFPVELGMEALIPPVVLFHGTTTATIPLIKESGLLSMSRQFVHLSASSQTAEEVGTRHGTPVILTIRAQEAQKAGVSFFQSANGVWLVEKLAPEFIEFSE